MKQAMSFTSNYVSCAGREIHYTEWGAQHKSVMVAWPVPGETWTSSPRTCLRAIA